MATCNVTFHFEDAGGTAAEGVVVRGKAMTPQSAESDATVVTSGWVSATSDVAGDATLALQQGAKCRIVCNDAGLDFLFTVPQTSSYVFARELAGGQS
jgi:hypothetical protein